MDFCKLLQHSVILIFASGPQQLIVAPTSVDSLKILCHRFGNRSTDIMPPPAVVARQTDKNNTSTR